MFFMYSLTQNVAGIFLYGVIWEKELESVFFVEDTSVNLETKKEQLNNIFHTGDIQYSKAIHL